MDRFGDDLTEEILQYLTFEDKIRLECVSKQWRRLVFNKQFAIDLFFKHKDDYYRDYFIKDDYRYYLPESVMMNMVRVTHHKRKSAEIVLKTLLKKCPNITKVNVQFGMRVEVLSVIADHCPNIKSLEGLPFNDSTYLTIFRKFSYKLEEFYGPHDTYRRVAEKYLRHCPNVKKISGIYSIFRNADHDYLPKVEKIYKKPYITSGNYYCDKKVTIEEFKIFSDKYSQTIKTLDVEFGRMTAEELKTCFECIARFENLKELKLLFCHLEIEVPIDECLSLIGQKCNKLLKLDLCIYESVPISDEFFAIFSKFKSIKKLKVKLSHNRVLSGSVKCFKHCKQLIDLDITYTELREDFFAYIASFVPKLQLLRITTEKEFSLSFIDYFHSMKNLQKLKHYVSYGEKTNWYFGKRLSEVMLSPNGVYVKPITNNCGRIKYD